MDRFPAKISVILTKEDSARFAAFCHERGFKKSTLIARLIRDFLDEEGYEYQPSLFDQSTEKTEA